MKALHHTKRWAKKAKAIRSRDGHMDQAAWLLMGIRQDADMVHHIYPVEDYPEYAYEDWNLMSTSRSTHNQLHNPDGSLTRLGEDLQRMVKIGKDWRPPYQNDKNQTNPNGGV